MKVNQSFENIQRLKEMTKRMRLDALDMAIAAGNNGAHLGGSLSSMEMISVLYGEVMNIDAKNPHWEQRDRFLPSKWHCQLALFPALVEKGYFTKEEMLAFTKDGSPLAGYPQNIDLGLEYAGGTLGMALSVGVGLAYSAREKKQSNRIYVLMGDGEMNEGQIWEAFMSGAQYKLGNLVALIDRNHLSYDGDTEDVMGIDDFGAKMRAFNWNTIECDGHDIGDLLRAFSEIRDDIPNIIIADTIKGKGVSFIENRREWHQKAITKEQYEQACQEVKEGE